MKHNTIIIYKSSTGFTKKYAQMISEETGFPLADYKTATAKTMSAYERVVFGSRAHAGRIDGYSKIEAMFRKSDAQSFVLFATGAMPTEAEDTIKAFWAQNLGAQLSTIPHFYLPAGLCYERMSLPDKLMMKAAAAMMKKKKDKTAEDLEFERAIAGSYDISDRAYIEPLVSFLGRSSR